MNHVRVLPPSQTNQPKLNGSPMHAILLLLKMTSSISHMTCNPSVCQSYCYVLIRLYVHALMSCRTKPFLIYQLEIMSDHFPLFIHPLTHFSTTYVYSSVSESVHSCAWSNQNHQLNNRDIIQTLIQVT
jgi:hypothetical protein